MVLAFLVAFTGLIICATFFILTTLDFPLPVLQVMFLLSQFTIFYLFINNILVLVVTHDRLAIFEWVFRI